MNDEIVDEVAVKRMSEGSDELGIRMREFVRMIKRLAPPVVPPDPAIPLFTPLPIPDFLPVSIWTPFHRSRKRT